MQVVRAGGSGPAPCLATVASNRVTFSATDMRSLWLLAALQEGIREVSGTSIGHNSLVPTILENNGVRVGHEAGGHGPHPGVHAAARWG